MSEAKYVSILLLKTTKYSSRKHCGDTFTASIASVGAVQSIICIADNKSRFMKYNVFH
jgi:hypothetical protein